MKQLYGKVNNPSGLTSRLSAELVAEANRTSCKVTLYSHDEEAASRNADPDAVCPLLRSRPG